MLSWRCGCCLPLTPIFEAQGADKLRWWILFAIAAALAQYAHNLAAFYLIPLAITPILQRDWKSLKAVLLAGLGAVVLYIPWLIEIPGQFAKVEQSYWVARPDLSRLFTLLLVFTTNLPLPNNWLPIALFIALLLMIVGILQTIRAIQKDSAARRIMDFIFIICAASTFISFFAMGAGLH